MRTTDASGRKRDEVHAEITEIVDGLSQFSESRELFKPYRYQRIVAAIVAACA
jgi:hypothetical protein